MTNLVGIQFLVVDMAFLGQIRHYKHYLMWSLRAFSSYKV